MNGWAGRESVRGVVELNNGFDALEELCKHPNYDIYQLAEEIITKYCTDNNNKENTDENRTGAFCI